MARILVVDDEASLRDAVVEALRRAGHEAVPAASGRDGLDRLAAEGAALVITDLKMPGLDGLQVLEEVKRASPETAVIVVTAHGTVGTAVAAMKRGAWDFIQKPFPLEELEVLVARALEHRALAAENEALRARLAGQPAETTWDAGPALRALHEQLARAAASDATVLLTGESGTGKEVAALELHRLSPRRAGPFLAVNCAALSAGLLESELFGHEKGAFTGADRPRKGRFEIAEGGTLLLDEVSEIEPALQAKLLRVLQERSFERVGSSQPRRADVRVVATTNRDLKAEAARGRFREDLYFRLNVLPLRLPPLRERADEIPALAALLLRRAGSRKRFAPAALRRLAAYSWPGNVRELGNIVERAAVLAPGDEIDEATVAPWLDGAAPGGDGLSAWLGRPIEDLEREFVSRSLAHHAGNRERTARALGITSRTLRDKLRKWGAGEA